jgi:site-specific DNA-cytosine methylase
MYFAGFIRNNILSENKCKKLFTSLSNNLITIDSFFLLELREIVLEVIEKQNKFSYSVNVKTLNNLLIELEKNTWLGKEHNGSFKLDYKHMEDVLKVRAKDFQEPVYEDYEYKKNALNNRGLLLDMATGTGKTYTSISIMVGSKVDVQIYVVMSKNIKLLDVLDENPKSSCELSEARLRWLLSDKGQECLKKRYASLDPEKASCLTARSDASWNCNYVTRNGKITKLTCEEYEKLQTVPVGYTSCVSDSQRYKMLGNGWTVDVIVHIFQGLK